MLSGLEFPEAGRHRPHGFAMPAHTMILTPLTQPLAVDADQIECGDNWIDGDVNLTVYWVSQLVESFQHVHTHAYARSGSRIGSWIDWPSRNDRLGQPAGDGCRNVRTALSAGLAEGRRAQQGRAPRAGDRTRRAGNCRNAGWNRLRRRPVSVARERLAPARNRRAGVAHPGGPTALRPAGTSFVPTVSCQQNYYRVRICGTDPELADGQGRRETYAVRGRSRGPL